MFKHFQGAVLALAFSSLFFSAHPYQADASEMPLPVRAALGEAVVLDPTDGFEWRVGSQLYPVWSWEARPGTSVADFSDATVLRPTFTPDVNGSWIAKLDLFDDPAATDPVTTLFLNVSTEALPPVAHIQARGLSGASPLTLDGSPSYDVDGDALSYSWSILSAPAGHAAAFDAVDAPIVDFSFDLPGSYVVGLSVQDSSGLTSEVATFQIDVPGASSDLDVDATIETFNLVTESFFGRQEVEGRTFIGSTIQNVTGQFGFAPANDGAAFAEMYVDGDVQNSTINLTPGDELRVSGSVTGSNINNGTFVDGATDLPAFDFEIFKAQSAFLATLTGAPADLSDQNNKRFGGAPNAVAGEADFGPNTRIVTATMSDLQSGGYSIDLSQADTVIINVSGQSGNFQMNPLGGTGFAENVLWNFYEATSINVNAVIVGHILAPHAQMSGFAGSSEGTVIARDVQLTNGELHQRAWLGQVPAALVGPDPVGDLPPVASARFDQLAAAESVPLTLEPFASTDINGGPIGAIASIISAPAGSAPSLSVDGNAVATFTGDIAGDYLIGYEVRDGARISRDQVLIIVGGGNTRPTAVIADITAATVDVAISLDGSQSTDLDGDLLNYDWALLSAPAGSTAAIVDGAGPLAALTPDVDGLYIVQLTANDGSADSVPATYLIQVGAPLPLADAGRDQLPDANGQAVLDGSLSTGTTFQWSLLGLTGGGATLDDAALVAPTLTLPPLTEEARVAIRTQTVFQINRGDLGGLCVYDTRLPADIPNPATSGWHGIAFWANGVVNDGSGRPVWVIDNQRDFTRVVELVDTTGIARGSFTVPGRVRAYVTTDPLPGGAQIRVLLDGNQINQQSPATYNFNRTDETCSGSGTALAQLIVANASGVSLPETVFVGDTNLRPVLTRTTVQQIQGGTPVSLSAPASAFDANGDTLSYSWSLIHRPAGSAATIATDPTVVKVTGETLDFTPDRPGLFLIQLEATDGTNAAVPVVFVIEVLNDPPVASALTPADTFVGDPATLDGSASFDPNGDAITYNWNITSAPAGSTATIPDPFGPMATFIPDARGFYTFQLEVADFEASDTTSVTLNVPNRAPVAVFEGPVEISPGVQASFSALGSSDLDGDALTYTFAVLATPQGASAQLAGLDDGVVGVTVDTVGEYTLEVTASDGTDSASATLVVTAETLNAAPILGDIRDLYTVELGLELALDLTGTDPDGGPVSFFATSLPLPEGVTLDANTGELRFRPEAGQEGNYSITIGVSDGTFTDEAVLNIEVVPGSANDTSVFGRVLDAADFANGVETPLAGIPVRLRDSALMAVTEVDGTFDFGSLTGGRDRVLIEPSKEGGPGGYLGTERDITITENQARDLAPDFLLTPLNDGCALVVAGAETVLDGTTSGVTVRIAADTIQNADGSLYAGEVCLGQLPQLSAQSGFPVGTQACNVYGLDAQGATFTQGATISAPNTDLLPEGTRLALWQQNIQSGRFGPSANAFVDTGGATVSADAGLFTRSTLFSFLPQAPRSVASADQAGAYKTLTLFEGNLNEVYTPPGYSAFSEAQTVGLSYHSQAANPTIIVAGDVTIAADASLPVTLSSFLDIGGLSIADANQWTPRQGLDGSAPALVGEELTLRQSLPLDAQGLDSGRYGYDFRAAASYACSTVSSQHQSTLYVQNEADSPYGRGWAIDGLQRIVPGEDGSVTIIDDDGITFFDRENDFTEFDENPVIIPADEPISIAVGDFDGDGRTDLAIAESGEGDVALIRNFGQREFTRVDTLDVAGPKRQSDGDPELEPDITAIGALDFDRDGFIDIPYVTQIDTDIGFLKGDGFFGFTDNVIFQRANVVNLLVEDIDGDGFEDVVYGGINGFFLVRPEIRAFFGGPNGFTDGRVALFGEFGLQRWVQPVEILADDIDGDGRIDIAMRSERGIHFAFGQGGRSFTSTTTNLGNSGFFVLGEHLDVSDVNGDGFKEVFLVQSNGFIYYPNNGGRSFGAPVTLQRPPGSIAASNFFLLDVDEDPGEDILYSLENVLTVYSSNNDGTFAAGELSQIDYPIFLNFIVEDMNGDGALDLVSMQPGENGSVTIDFSKATTDGVLIGADGEFSTLVELPGGGWERRYKDGTVVEFNAAGLQSALVDTQGNRIEYVYDAEGRLLQKTDQVGRVTSFAYENAGQLSAITYPDGRVTQFEIGPQGNLVEVTEPTGGQWTYNYDENGRLTRVTDENGNSTAHTYGSAGDYKGTIYPDGSSVSTSAGSYLGVDLSAPQPLSFVAPGDRVTTQTDERGGVTQVTVNEFGAITRTIDPIGRETIYTRDEANLVTRLVRPNDADPSGQRIDEMTYDARGNMLTLATGVGTALERTKSYTYEPTFSKVTSYTDFGGFTTTYIYDEFGELVLMMNPLGDARAYAYNPEGLMSSMTDENGNVTTYDYNADFNMSSSTLPDGSVMEYVYDDRGNVLQLTEAAGLPEQRTYVREYDSLNRVISEEVLDAAGVSLDGKRFFEFDLADNLVAFQDETGLRVEYTYDEMNREIAVSEPAYGTTTSDYDVAGELIAETDAEGITQTWEYDIVDRLVETTDGIGNRSIFAYDVSDNLIQVDDARGNTTTFGFDIFDRRIRRTNPISQTITMVYDERDNLTRITRENGDIEEATYDGLSRRLTVTTPDNVLVFGYDPYGNLTAANDDDTGLSLDYDSRHRLIEAVTDGTKGPQPASTITYTYDAINQRQTMTDHLNATWTYNFDEKSRVVGLTAPWGDTHSMDYDEAGRRLELANTTGRLTEATWSSDRLEQLAHFQNAAPVARSGYSYTPDGSLEIDRDLEDPSKSETLFYDGINRLLQVSEGVPTADGGTPIPTEDYAYDPTGNRTSSHISTGYQVDNHNRLISTDDYSYTYDEKGNRTTRTRLADGVVETYSYNSMNQLVAVASTAGLDAEYFYDALGRRVAKRVGTDTRAYVYDIAYLRDITAHDVLLEYENGALDKRWLNGQQIDEPVAFEGYGADATVGAGTAYALHGDRQSSIIAITEQATGTIAARYEYDAFGQRDVLSGAGLQDYGFTGREFDDETGLYYYRARHYDPEAGRFLQSDPIGFAAGDLNLYAYTWNDPANWTDPSGLAASSDKASLTAGVVGLGRAAVRPVAKGARCLANKISTFLTGVGRVLAQGRDLTKMKVAAGPGCRTRVAAPKCRCGKGAGGLAGGGFGRSSFPAGTEVLTPEGKVAIEALREGDLVIARDEDTGQSGVYSVTAVMSRQATDVLWLTLENAAGKTTKMGVTSEHPLFAVGEGWIDAGDLVAGDTVRDSNLSELIVLAVAFDTQPQRVHNLEVAGAHTYFAGELEAWGHNISGPNSPSSPTGAYFFKLRNGQVYSGKGPKSRCRASIIQRMKQTGSDIAWWLYFPAQTDDEAKIMEDQLICDSGGKDDPGNLNERNGPGRKMRGE